MSLIIRKTLCSSCIFGPNSPITKERLQQLKNDWDQNEQIQICHHEQIAGLQTGCRGHLEAAKRGEIPHPLIKTTSKVLNLNPATLDLETAIQVCERLGFLIYKNREEDDKTK